MSRISIPEHSSLVPAFRLTFLRIITSIAPEYTEMGLFLNGR
jgi:hypothetical protein